jgi:hypothetical protein
MTLKVFNLQCDGRHAFEGWFGSADDFDSQRSKGLLSCPMCGSHAVDKLPAAPYVGSSQRAQDGPRQAAAKPTPAQMQAMLAHLARQVVAQTEDVGDRFVEEARRIHYNEAPERGIRGVASPADAQALHEEGIDVMPLPFLPPAKQPLQ